MATWPFDVLELSMFLPESLRYIWVGVDSLPERDVVWTHCSTIEELWNWVGLIEKTLQGILKDNLNCNVVMAVPAYFGACDTVFLKISHLVPVPA